MTLLAENSCCFPVNSLWTDGRGVAVTGGAVPGGALPPPEILEHSGRWRRFLWGAQDDLKQIGKIKRGIAIAIIPSS